MNRLLFRLLITAACLVMGFSTLLRMIQVQHSFYPVAPPTNSARLPNLVHERQVSPLFNPDHAGDLLEGAKRDKWQQPQRLVEQLHLQPGEIVADIGAGSGYLMPYLSRGVSTQGGVFEEEIQAEYISILRQKARSFSNTRVILGRANNPRLPRSSVDCFVLLTVYHEVEYPVAFLQTLRQSARPDARLAIIDFDANIKGNPPAPEEHWVEEQTVIREAEEAGWELSERHDFLRQASQFYLVFRPRKQ